MLYRLAALLTQRPALVLAAALVVTVLAFAVIFDFRELTPRIPIDPSIDQISERESADGEKTLLVALRFETLFAPEALGQLRDFIEYLERSEQVDRVDSLANAIQVDSSMGFPDVRGALDVLPADDDEAQALRKEILASPLYSPLVSRDSRAALVAITPLAGAELDIEGIRSQAATRAPDASLLVTGAYFADREALPILIKDLQQTIPLALLALTLVATFALRSFRGVVLAVSADAIATLLTVAFFVVIGWELNLVTVITPVVVLVVGFAYTVHVLTEFDHQLFQDAVAPRAAVARTLAVIAPPLALTAITTCAGFLSLLLSRIDAIREFGIICAVGVAVALATALLVLPAALALWPPTVTRSSGREFSRFNDRWAARFAALALRRRGLLLALGIIVTVVASFGVLRIKTSTDFVSNFKADSSVRRDFEQLNRDFAGGVPVEIEVRGAPEAFREPKNLRELSDLQARLREHPEVGSTTSFSDYISFLYLHLGDASEPGAIPKNDRVVEQLLLGSPREAARRFVDDRHRETVVRVQLHNIASAELLDWVRRVEAELDATLPDYLKAKVVGNTVQVAATVEELTRGQVASISVALLVIFLVLALLFQSARAGVLALIPNVIPIIVYFGTLGLLGIPLNVTTALVACSVLGIAVDDSIHFLTRFNEAARARADETAGIQEALRHTLRPITVTTAALVAGLLALAMSDLRNIVEFGVLAAFTLAFTWLLDVTFTPALCGKLRFVTLWDSLTVDLGAAPNETIPLFADMSKRQARIAAMLASERWVKAGDRLLSHGDPGGSLFVVLDGELEINFDSEHPITSIGRGALVGESSAFGGRRNANVDARTEVRLLRWTSKDLDRIQSRHPRVAVPLLRNLARSMAERWSETQERLHTFQHPG